MQEDTMTLKDRIANDLKEAMKAGDALRKDTLRSAISAFSYRRIDAGRELDESEQVDAIRKLVKQRSDSIAEYERGKRPDLVERERLEREILAAYLPAGKSEDELRAIVRAAIAPLEPAERKEGALMKRLMPALRADADGSVIRRLVLEELAAG
ncbi:MAG: GatB/YqeY domain-containing protein [Candidatus Baltobacteraceae bacterium]